MPDQSKTYKVKSNEFEFVFSENEIEQLDLIKKSPSTYNMIFNNRSVNIQVIENNSSSKKMSIEIDGEIYITEIKDNLDQMLEQMGFGLSAAKQIKEIKAPMPGLVLQIAVTEGQEVAEGDKILILEAMKMENSILIPASAKIKKINVKAGQAVEKGQVLIELD